MANAGLQNSRMVIPALGASAASAYGQVLGNVSACRPWYSNFDIGAVAGAGFGAGLASAQVGFAGVGSRAALNSTALRNFPRIVNGVAIVAEGVADGVAAGIGELVGSIPSLLQSYLGW